MPEKYWSKDKFDKLLQDPETYYKEKAEKELHNQGDIAATKGLSHKLSIADTEKTKR